MAESASNWAASLESRDIGVIAGTLSVGLGRIVAKLPTPNDGSVAVTETRWSGLTDHLTLAATHTTLVTSREVADQIAHFLNHAEFSRERKSGP